MAGSFFNCYRAGLLLLVASTVSFDGFAMPNQSQSSIKENPPEEVTLPAEGGAESPASRPPNACVEWREMTEKKQGKAAQKLLGSIDFLRTLIEKRPNINEDQMAEIVERLLELNTQAGVLSSCDIEPFNSTSPEEWLKLGESVPGQAIEETEPEPDPESTSETNDECVDRFGNPCDEDSFDNLFE